MRDIVSGGIAVVTAWVLVGVVRRYALSRAILDQPKERSSHTVPTPRGGGLGLVAAFLLSFVTWNAPRLEWRLWLSLGAVVLAAGVGWRDDHVDMKVSARLATHIAAGCLLVPLALSPTSAPQWLAVGAAVWWICWVVSAINVVNFMDGIDGLIGLQALIFGVHLWVASPETTLTHSYGLLLAGASLGFLIWNWAPARIFLGDVGSGALGAAIVLGGLLLLRATTHGLVATYLPLYPIFLDAAVTLAARAWRGEPLTLAHRSHLYQRLANGGWGHRRVSTLYGGVSILGAALVWAGSSVQGVTFGTYIVLVAALGWVLDRNLKGVQARESGWPPHSTP